MKEGKRNSVGILCKLSDCRKEKLSLWRFLMRKDEDYTLPCTGEVLDA